MPLQIRAKERVEAVLGRLRSTNTYGRFHTSRPRHDESRNRLACGEPAAFIRASRIEGMRLQHAPGRLFDGACSMAPVRWRLFDGGCSMAADRRTPTEAEPGTTHTVDFTWQIHFCVGSSHIANAQPARASTQRRPARQSQEHRHRLPTDLAGVTLSGGRHRPPARMKATLAPELAPDTLVTGAAPRNPKQHVIMRPDHSRSCMRPHMKDDAKCQTVTLGAQDVTAPKAI